MAAQPKTILKKLGVTFKPEDDYKVAPDKICCEVNTLLYRPHNGFANYTIATLKIVDGKVTEIQYSDPYNGTEALMKMDIANGYLLEKMRRDYPPGLVSR